MITLAYTGEIMRKPDFCIVATLLEAACQAPDFAPEVYDRIAPEWMILMGNPPVVPECG
jgi:hypothetical protein